MNKWFSKFANLVSDWAGTHYAFVASALLIIVWAIYAWPHKFDSNSQMIVNTSTTIINFLMIFLVQHAQNRHAKEQEIKNNEILRAIEGARNEFINLKDKSDEELKEIEEELIEEGQTQTGPYN